MDNVIMRRCFELPDNFDCSVCDYANEDFHRGGDLVAGPCGQQNCWYSCTVCEYNHMDTCHADEEE